MLNFILIIFVKMILKTYKHKCVNLFYYVPHISLSSDYGSELSGYIRELMMNVTDETGDLYYVSVQATNGAGAKSDVVSSRPIHVYGANVPGTVSDGRKVTTFCSLVISGQIM